MVYFTQLVKRPVRDKEGKRIGELTDLAFIDGEKYAEVSHLLISEEGTYKKLSWDYIRELIDTRNNKKVDVDIVLTKRSADIKRERIEGDELLVKNLLDRQIVDITGIKVVRANDIVLRKVANKFCIVGVDVGGGSILRRLGVDLFGAFAQSETFLPWEYVEPIDKEVHSLRVKVDRSKLSQLHPADIADIMEDLNPKQRILIFNELDERTAAKALVETEPEVSRAMINRVQTKKVLTLLKKLDVDEVAEVLALIPKEKSDFIVSKLSPRVKKMITKVLGYPEDSAGRAMNPDILSATENMTVQQVIDKIRGLAPKSNGHYYVYVVDKEGKLIGVLSLHELIVSNLQAKIIDIANRNVIKVTTRTHKDEASKIIIRYSLSALPVVDREGVLRGKITMHDIMDETAEKSFLTKPKHAALLKRYPRKQKHAPTTSKKKPSQ